ncbi:MAG: hypothetical protein HYZ44_14155 [Bacteroidetes bacterium]|nr:hypothetical protein [Bacteroidota bacterium]
MNGQSILFRVTVWVILTGNVFYTVSSIFINEEVFETRSAFALTNFVFYLAAVVLLLENGTLIRSKLIYLMVVSIVAVIAGLLFKIQHWALASEILVIGLCTCLCVYLIHFFRKPNLAMLDYLKLIWVVLYVAFSLDVVLRFYLLREWIEVRDLAFLIMLAYYTYMFTIKKSIPISAD